MNYSTEIENFKDPRIRVVEKFESGGTLYYTLELEPRDSYTCPKCGSPDTILFGIRPKRLSIVLDAAYRNSVVLRAHRVRCKRCLATFDDSTEEAPKGSSISRRTLVRALDLMRADVSFTFISNELQLSLDTVIRIFEEYVPERSLPLPEVICVDEFKNLKGSAGKYAFLILDPVAGKVVDVLPDRRLETIKSYLRRKSLSETANVKYVVSDMNENYRNLAKIYFPNATYVVDCFHYVRYVEDAFNAVRVRVQSGFRQSDPEYRLLKSRWRILSSYRMALDLEESYNPVRKRETSADELIEDSLSTSEDLREAYGLVQGFLRSTRECKYEDARATIDAWIESLRNARSKELNELAKTFINWEGEIVNSFLRFGERRLSNGPIEGMNNRIKEIKRVSFGYRTFRNFRKRLMFIINNDDAKKIKL